VPVSTPVTQVRVHNTNTGKVIRIAVPIEGRGPAVEGDFAVDGVPGSGAEIAMDFADTTGACTGRLLPTGRARDRIRVPSLAREIDVSIVDAANPCVFIDAAALGLTGAELPAAIPETTVDVLEEIRQASCRIAGIDSYLLPFQVIVGRPRSYPTYSGRSTIPAGQCDLVARLFCDRGMHKAYPGTGATCIAVAAGIAGTIVNECHRGGAGVLRIGHPSGIMPIFADVAAEGDGWRVRRVGFSRTARRLMDGYAYVRKTRIVSPAGNAATLDPRTANRAAAATEAAG
jgi:2-methylaconitate cis-trans-isomerase PrpF